MFNKAMIEKFLYMTWLRPENVIWDVTAARLIGEELQRGGQIAEIGTGNGYFTFMALGGEFKPEYDWYYNVDINGFWENKDIYDCVKLTNIGDFVQKQVTKRLAVSIDHKQSLLDQAGQLGFIDRLICQDANQSFELPNVDTVYSNILYWLNDPIATITAIAQQMKEGAQLVIVFPNSDFTKHCRSYSMENKMWTMINRGRADCLMWNLDMSEFEKQIQSKTGLEIIRHERYLSKMTLQTWDIGFRPFSPHLIKIANSLSPSLRLEVKEEWCETARPFVDELLSNELEKGHQEGGFNFVVLKKSNK